jgi:alpha-1,3-rhamnosyl/mannosyltransferase
MRVLIDTTYARRAPLSGTGIYIDRLLSELEAMSEVEPLAVSNPRRRPPAGGGGGSLRNLLADEWWTRVELPRLARARRAELIHHPLPARAALAGVPQLVTVVDLAFEALPWAFDRGYRTYAHLAHRAAARAAAQVICISESTAREAERFWGIERGRITVAPLGPGQALPAAERPDPVPTHFLYVGDAEPRKNLVQLLAAYARYRASAAEPLELVLAGSAVAEGAGVRAERRPASQRLAELLQGAAALVHPSLHEGFGLTPLEAMRLGTPVLAVRSAGVAEVCGGAARYIEPGDAEGLAASMAELAARADLRAALSARGRERAAGFSWAQCARLHLDAYSLALG